MGRERKNSNARETTRTKSLKWPFRAPGRQAVAVIVAVVVAVIVCLTLYNSKKVQDPACLEPQKVGMCSGKIPAVFYNATSGRCESFLFTGCQGNANNFQTMEECQAACEID